jgi:hypothetical protein
MAIAEPVMEGLPLFMGMTFFGVPHSLEVSMQRDGEAP